MNVRNSGEQHLAITCFNKIELTQREIPYFHSIFSCSKKSFSNNFERSQQIKTWQLLSQVPIYNFCLSHQYWKDKVYQVCVKTQKSLTSYKTLKNAMKFQIVKSFRLLTMKCNGLFKLLIFIYWIINSLSLGARERAYKNKLAEKLKSRQMKEECRKIMMYEWRMMKDEDWRLNDEQSQCPPLRFWSRESSRMIWGTPDDDTIHIW